MQLVHEFVEYQRCSAILVVPLGEESQVATPNLILYRSQAEFSGSPGAGRRSSGSDNRRWQNFELRLPMARRGMRNATQCRLL